MPIEKSSGADRREEPRYPANGVVRLHQPGSSEAPIDGRLLDTAKNGFRVGHDRFTLGSGELVDFEYEGSCGLARAMWTRIAGDHVETGFRICERRPLTSSSSSSAPPSLRPLQQAGDSRKAG